jgi:hypothetical protein
MTPLFEKGQAADSKGFSGGSRIFEPVFAASAPKQT